MYTGREYDRGLKLYYNRARYYDPKLARFISRDPIDIADDVNLYAYVGNNSVMFVDLMGTEKSIILSINLFDDQEFLGHWENIGLDLIPNSEIVQKNVSGIVIGSHGNILSLPSNTVIENYNGVESLIDFFTIPNAY